MIHIYKVRAQINIKNKQIKNEENYNKTSTNSFGKEENFQFSDKTVNFKSKVFEKNKKIAKDAYEMKRIIRENFLMIKEKIK